MFWLLENRENRENNLIWYECIDLGLPVCEKTEKTGKTRTFKDANNAVLLGLVSLHTNTVLC